MGYVFEKEGMNKILSELSENYLIYAPKLYVGGGRLSDTDLVRYGEVNRIDEIVFDKKSEFSFKEVLTPITQTLFYYTEDTVKEAGGPKKGAVIFLRSCDLHAVKRLDDMYLSNGPVDSYYERIREKVKFVLIGCSNAFDNCFCVDMGTNISENYDMSIDCINQTYRVVCKCEDLDSLLRANAVKEEVVAPEYVKETKTHVNIPDNLDAKVASSSIWREYDSRCIGCGRCNFVCPTCTCFTMQDIFYTDNGKVGERRRVWASCMVDGYTEVAGGGSYRQNYGDRMRFKVLHKVLDYKERSGYHMCVGCGRCDDICPEYISFSNCINKLGSAMEEVTSNES